jgi:hypothetical protein
VLLLGALQFIAYAFLLLCSLIPQLFFLPCSLTAQGAIFAALLFYTNTAIPAACAMMFSASLAASQ